MRGIKKYYFLVLPMLLSASQGIAQSQFQIWGGGNLGGAIYKQDFGVGNGDVHVAGDALPAGITSFPYSNDVCPPAGYYSIVEQVNVDKCGGDKWRVISLDHNQQIKSGRMMFVHNSASEASRIVFVDTIKQPLCAGTVYEFSAAIINIDNLDGCSDASDFPRFLFTIENAIGVPLVSYTSPDIKAYPLSVTSGILWKYSIYGLDYTVPANIDKLVLKIKLLPSKNDFNCNNDFAIDDILFSPAGPASRISFDSLPDGSTVTGVCFQDNKSISMAGSTDPFYNTTAYQWERSSDGGHSWEDIAGANSTAYAQNFPVSDTFLFRMRTSDISTINEPGCGVVSNALKVEVDGIPAGFKVSNNSPLCSGDDLTFTAEGGASYTWSGPNGFYDDIAYAHIFNASLKDSGTYYVQVITYGGCKAKDSTHVIMKGLPDITAGPDTSICKGSSVILNCTQGMSYSWSPGDGLSSTSIPDPVATPQVSTKYTVTVSDGSGCSNKGSVEVNLLNSIAVKASISGSALVCWPVDTVTLINESLGEIKSSYWDFDNGKSSVVFDPAPQNYTVDINRPDYKVRLSVTDSAGCSDTAYHIIKVESNCYIAVPTAFTPNGDGLNDYLYPLNAFKATDLTFKVFNRLGQLVFETNDWTKKWNGNVNSEPQPLGVYVWMLNYTDGNKKEVSLKGSTMLIR
jgi:gliding motility-associated-like protein